MKKLLLAVVALVGMAGCSKSDSTSTSTSSADNGQVIALQLNWKPEPQFGGFYAADYAKQGLKVDIREGGAGAPTIELLAAGKVPFGIVSADEIPRARLQGAKIVALYAVYQKHPQGILTHEARGFNELGDVFAADGVLAMESGLPYSDFLRKKYKFNDKLKIVPSPNGDLSIFQQDKNYSTQCFVTSEPLAAKKLGLQVKTFLISDSGFNPYATVLATSDDYLKDHPETVKKMVAAVAQGWQTYLEDAAPTNTVMHSKNPAMDLATFNESAQAQKPLIETDETKVNGVGSMTSERWTTLISQLTDLKVIDKPVKAEDCYKTIQP